MKKKVIAMMLAAAVAATAAGCGSKGLSNEYVTVTQYKGLEVAKVETEEVTDDQVEEANQANLQNTAEKVTVTDRAAQTGDWVNIDFTGYLDGVEFENGSAQAQDLQLGSGSFIGASGDYAGFEDQIVGHQTGEEFDITVQFPDNYSEDMAGKVADFHIVLNEIYNESVLELTDEWVQANITDADTVEEYKTNLRTQLEKQAEESARNQLMSYVQTELLENIEVKKYPEDKVDELVTEMEDYYTQMAAMYGVELTEFIVNYLGTTEDDFHSRIKESAQQTVAINEAVKLIAEKQKLQPSDEEFEKRAKEYAEQSGMDDVTAFMEQVGEDTLKEQIQLDLVMEYLADECVQVEDSAE